MNAKRLAALGCLACLLIGPGGAALAQEDPGFMPKGGKTLLLQVLGNQPAELRRIAGLTLSDAQWLAELAPHTGALSEREQRTLAAYLAVNLPLEPALADQAAQQAGWATALPADGRDLAWNYCQFCHSLFTGYLTQERDVQAWRGEFEAPFHKELEMTAKQRETFARYSAVNMPMKVEDVPPDLRF